MINLNSLWLLRQKSRSLFQLSLWKSAKKSPNDRLIFQVATTIDPQPAQPAHGLSLKLESRNCARFRSAGFNYRPWGFGKEISWIGWKKNEILTYSNIYQPSVENNNNNNNNNNHNRSMVISTHRNHHFGLPWPYHLVKPPWRRRVRRVRVGGLLYPFEGHHTETLMAVKWELSGI